MEQGFSVASSTSEDLGDKLAGLLSRTSAKLLLLSLAVVLTYFHTLDVPFYFDGYTSIRDNVYIRDLATVWDFSRARFVGYLTFALNYAVHGYEVWGYHLVNILIHLGASLTVFFLASGILRTRAVAPYCSAEVAQWLPLLAALVFALHPLQIQAVTYTTQRLASLAALFYLLSLTAWLRARLAQEMNRRLLFFGLAGAFALLAFLTKQNTVTLPLAVLLLEICLLRPSRKFMLGLVGTGLAGLLAVVLYFQFALGQSFLVFLAESTLETDTVSRSEYFTVQMQVLWNYLYKFFLPLTLHLDYDLAVPASFWNFKTLVFALGHLALIGAALGLIRRSPVIAFGILFYYAAHLVESSVIPIRDFAFEHRTYLPNAGLCLALAWAMAAILPRYLPRRAIAGIAVLLVAVLGTLTWLRNEVWRDPVAFFQHEVAVNPGNFRAHSMLGENYLRLGRAEEALQSYHSALPLYGSLLHKETNAEVAFFSNYVLALDETGNYDEAIELIEGLDLEGMPGWAQAMFLSRRGIIHAKTNRFEQAEADFQAALRANPQNLDALNNYSKLLLISGRVEPSRELFERVLGFDPASADPQLAEFFRNNPAPPAQ